MPEVQLSVPGDLWGWQPVRFTVEYECSDSDAMGIVMTTEAPLVVVRGAPGGPAAYFIYSWDERTGHVHVSAAPENPVQLRPARLLTNRLLAARQSALSGKPTFGRGQTAVIGSGLGARLAWEMAPAAGVEITASQKRDQVTGCNLY